MARAIDANELEMFPYSEGAGTEEQISEWIDQTGLSEDDTASRARDLCWKVIDGFINVVKTQPTLTSPNEGAKGKNVPTNDPLTLEEVRLMIEPTPVWWDWFQGWVLARKGMIISWNGVYYNFEEVKGKFYRRPPEEPLTCEGCVHEINEHENCNYCIRAGSLSDYYCRRPPEGEEEN